MNRESCLNADDNTSATPGLPRVGATTTPQRHEQNDFDQARALFLSHAVEGAEDSQLPTILMQIRETCGPDAFNRILVLAAALDDARFDEYGCADVLPLLRDLTITDDLNADVGALLDEMRKEDEQAWREAHEEADPYHRAAVRLMQFRNLNLAQVMRELERL